MTGRGRARVGRGRLPPRQDDPEAMPQPGAQGPPGAQAVQPPQPQYPFPAQPPPQAETPFQPQGRGRGRGRGWGVVPPVPQGIAPAQRISGRAGLMLGVPRHMQPQQQPMHAPQVQPPQQMAPPQQMVPPQPISPPQTQPQEFQTAPPRSGVGRAAFRGGVAPAGEAPAETGPLTTGMSTMSIKGLQKREHFRLMRVLKYLDYDDIQTKPPISKIGTDGAPILLTTNYFKFEKFPEYQLRQYHVDFKPPVERRDERQKLLDVHAKILGYHRSFDGMILFTPHRLDGTPLELCSKQENGVIVTITIRETGEVPMTSPTFIQMVNIQMRKALALLQLRQIGHHYFNPDAPIQIPNRGLSVMPGFITAVKFHEGGLLLGVDVAHKVLRRETALDVLRCSRKTTTHEEMRDVADREILGRTVLTRYNNRTYLVDDVDFGSSPKDTFEKDGQKVTYIQYYKSQYDITIKDTTQPLLVSRPKIKDIRGGRPNMIYLIPELCSMTGLTSEQKNQGQLMRAMADATRVNPDKRIEKMLAFRSQLCTNEKTLPLLKNWEIVPEKHLLKTEGRVLPRQKVVMCPRRKKGEMKLELSKKKLIEIDFPAERPDWSHHFKTLEMPVSVDLKNWMCLYGPDNQNEARDIVNILMADGPKLGMDMVYPKMLQLGHDGADDFRRTIVKEMTRETQMVLAVVPNMNKKRYDAIKKVCCVEKPCPSQVVYAKLRQGVLRSACTKIAIQMNCKMGGFPWVIQMPLPDTMYIGIDTFHDSAQRKKSAVGFVATLDRNCTSYFCDCTIQELQGEELANTLGSLTKIATRKYMEVNGDRKPQKYIIYRDGVGDGMLRIVNDYEKKQVVDAIKEIYRGEPVEKRPLVYFFVVKKRILTRLFTERKENPPPGTVVDKDITTEFWFDFFLISQSVGQGTVNPVHYNCIEMPRVAGLCLTADQLQTLTYRLCHLYYNWAGTIRVPMICMYAHKLAFLVGNSLHTPSDAVLCNRLFFL